MSKSEHTYLGHLEMLKHKSFSPDQLNVDGIEGILNLNQQFHGVFHHSIPMIYLMDYTSKQYLFITKSNRILGHNPEKFISGGLDFTLSNYNKKDLKIFNEEIFPDRIKFIQDISPQEQASYIFSYNYRMKKSDGEYTNLLQRNCFIKSDEKGNPLMSLGMVININNFKPENPIIQTIEKYTADKLADTTTIFKKAYYLNKEDGLLTKRELELLLYIADGLTSKEIANKLFISEHTVINHKRNMMQKCNARNTIELVTYAIRNRVI